MQDARLDSFEENGSEVVLLVQGLEVISSDVFEQDGKIVECVEARHVPLEISFFEMTQVSRSEFFTALEKYPPDDPSRIIAYMYSWRQSGVEDTFHMFGLRGPVDADMRFFAKRVTYKKGKSGSSFAFERDWSPSPPMPDRLVPEPHHIHRKFGGDPITINLGGRILHRRLFVGGVHIQPQHRPQVDAVLNVGEEPSTWTKNQPPDPSDRWDNKGEGLDGMSAEDIRAEANWVIERLQKDQRVLVHCAAGMNRSTTICCAVLMQLEGLSAEQALQRAYEHHPWAKPDSHHWLMLRWLEKNRKE
jgi:hypothetical protein